MDTLNLGKSLARQYLGMFCYQEDSNLSSKRAFGGPEEFIRHWARCGPTAVLILFNGHSAVPAPAEFVVDQNVATGYMIPEKSWVRKMILQWRSGALWAFACHQPMTSIFQIGKRNTTPLNSL
jgi:hypothetical protein